jgi:hypothetical protein
VAAQRRTWRFWNEKKLNLRRSGKFGDFGEKKAKLVAAQGTILRFWSERSYSCGRAAENLEILE